MLSRAGFEPREIAEMLGTTAAVISQQIYEQRKQRSGARKKARPQRSKARHP